ncbi:MAG TPA: hypothetical protein VND93_17225 [Myxococcales bacterium]|nr:hypothetical protein [Myxococcales bacterium]
MDAATAPSVAVPGARAARRRAVAVAVPLAVIGATLGPVLDGLHTWSGTIWYASPGWMRSVWWCPPLFCGAALSIGLSRLWLDRRSPPGAGARPSSGQVAWASLAFVAAYAASGYLPGGSLAKCAALGALAAGGWVALERTRAGLWHGALAAAGGWAVEYALVRAGLFTHLTGELAGVAAWIPLLYFSGATAIGLLARRLDPQ